MTLQDQPAYIIRMRAKPGSGDKLFELATIGVEKSGASDRFIILREDEDPDVLWTVEVFRSDASKDGYGTARWLTSRGTRFWDLLAEQPMRIPVYPDSAA